MVSNLVACEFFLAEWAKIRVLKIFFLLASLRLILLLGFLGVLAVAHVLIIVGYTHILEAVLARSII